MAAEEPILSILLSPYSGLEEAPAPEEVQPIPAELSPMSKPNEHYLQLARERRQFIAAASTSPPVVADDESDDSIGELSIVEFEEDSDLPGF